MASRLRLSSRASFPSQLHICSPYTTPNYSRQLSLSSTLHHAKRKASQTPKSTPSSPPSPPSREPYRSKKSPAPPPPSAEFTPPKPKLKLYRDNTPDKTPPSTLEDRRKWHRNMALPGALVVVFLTTLYVSTVLTNTYKNSSSSSSPTPSPTPTPSNPTTPHPTCCPPTGLPPSLTPISALQFDRSLDTSESLSRLTPRRIDLAGRAKGHVLEVACGTGRNLPYYSWEYVVHPFENYPPEEQQQKAQHRMAKILDIKRSFLGGSKSRVLPHERLVGGMEGEVLSYTAVDVSPEMLSVARNRLRESVPGLSDKMAKKRTEPYPSLAHREEVIPVVAALDNRVQLLLGDAEYDLPKQREKYDTIIQSFGLCSVTDPKGLLVNMAERVTPDTGRILLLEHGRGYFGWVNSWLDRYAPNHFAKFGCWWNRDIEGLVKAASEEYKGGKLEVVSMERPWYHGGTTVVLELRVNKEEGQKEK